LIVFAILFLFQPIPYTADSLLGSFYKLQDGSMLVGGKEAISCGIDPKSGKVSSVLFLKLPFFNL